MYGLQYSVLPRERVGLAEVWRILNDDETIDGDGNGKLKGGGAAERGYQNGHFRGVAGAPWAGGTGRRTR